MRFQYKTQILVELVEIQNLYISALYQSADCLGSVFDMKMERISSKNRSKTAFIHLFVG